MSGEKTAVSAPLVSTTQIVILVISLLLAFLSLRDLLFVLLGSVTAGFYLYTKFSNFLLKKNSNSRIIVLFEHAKDLPELPFVPNFMKDPPRDYFINSFTRGLHHVATFEEQIDVVKWVLTTERKLAAESLKEFGEFEKNLERLTRVSQSNGIDTTHHSDRLDNKLSSDLSLRDTTLQFSHLESLMLQEVDETPIKDVFSDMKIVIQEHHKANEELINLWSSLDNQTLDKLRSIFTSSSSVPLREHNLFALTNEDICETTPNLLDQSSKVYIFLSKLVESFPKLSASNLHRSNIEEVISPQVFFTSDWKQIRDKFGTPAESILTSYSTHLKSQMSKHSERLAQTLDSLKKSQQFVARLDEYFRETKDSLHNIQNDFEFKVQTIKRKIDEFKIKVDSNEPSVDRLILEYEIRTDIQKLYALKSTHETECVGLEKRLTEIEAFNSNTELLREIINSKIVEFFEECEDSIFRQEDNSAITRLFVLSNSDHRFSQLDWSSIKKHEIIDQLSESITPQQSHDEGFKTFLSQVLIGEYYDNQKGSMVNKELCEISNFVERKTEEINLLKETFKDLELDTANEMEEGIVINRVLETKIPLIRFDANNTTISDSSKIDNSSKRLDADWTNNKLKALRLKELLEKNFSVLEQELSILNDQLSITVKCEGRVNKMLSKYVKSSILCSLFKRLIRLYFGRRLCIQDLSKKIKLLVQLNYLAIKELEGLLTNIYDDEKIDKMMSIEAKKKIFKFLQVLKEVEVSTRALFVETTCSYLLREIILSHHLQHDRRQEPAQLTNVESIFDEQNRIHQGSIRDVPITEKSFEVTPIRDGTNKQLDADFPSSADKQGIAASGRKPSCPQSPTKAGETTMMGFTSAGAIINSNRHISTSRYLKLDSINKLLLTFCQEWCVNSYFQVGCLLTIEIRF